MRRLVVTLAVAFTLTSSAVAQPVNLAEKSAADDRARCVIELSLKGELFVVEAGKKESLRLEATARHTFAERTLAVADGLPTTSARHYEEATAAVIVAGEKMNRSLSADRRLIVARRTAEGLLCFAPTGPLSRDDLDLVTEHFNPQCLPGLLPGKAVNVGDTWAVSDEAAVAACLFDALIKAQITGKLTEVKDGVATFTIEGTAEGIESGAKVSLIVKATGTFDAAAGRITALNWKQTDTREQGPVSPASQIEATVNLRREPLTELPKELADAALAGVPAGEVPAKFTDLLHADPKGRYSVVYSRDWHITGQTDTHVVVRLLDKGEFIAQATVGVWRKAEPGKHTSAEEFKKAAGMAPGWTPTRVLNEGELPAAAGRWLYRLVVEGKMDDQPMLQAFYLLAGPQGDQVAVTVAVKPEKAKAVGTRDAALVNAIEFGKK